CATTIGNSLFDYW
nr:immunoglobulin heavy chain junction region [Macaca mulatta]MOY23165.1 immunoglobulin heavy chain junction region [Macaca mulatta]MOY23295.1 immunoglobulin heavy chain junction region [Macaca mulatta]MOY25221.1 immunoglobulin heavy chain junction region [Macaca mulatta]MOY25917.1 immunoglobulin heavy chain junction region [Macaca mulatta]